MSEHKRSPMEQNSNNGGALDELSRVRDIILGQYKEEQSQRQSNLEALFQSHLADIKSEFQKQMQDLKTHTDAAMAKLSESFKQLDQETSRIKEKMDSGVASLASGKADKDELAKAFSKLAGILTDPK